jgi:hypothetical protein
MKACTVCASPERHEIEAALAAGASIRAIAETYRVSRNALARHVHGAHAPGVDLSGWELGPPREARAALLGALREAQEALAGAHGAVRYARGVLATNPPSRAEALSKLESVIAMEGQSAATQAGLGEIVGQFRAVHGLRSSTTCSDWRLPLGALERLISRLESGEDGIEAPPATTSPGPVTRVIATCRLTDGRQQLAVPTPLGGRSLRFIRGVGTIVDSGIPRWRDADVVAALRLPGVEIAFEPSWHDAVPRWLELAQAPVGQAVRARIISPAIAPEPEPAEHPDPELPDTPEGALAAVLRLARAELANPAPTLYQAWRAPVRRLQLALKSGPCRANPALHSTLREIAAQAASVHGYALYPDLRVSCTDVHVPIARLQELEARLLAHQEAA